MVKKKSGWETGLNFKLRLGVDLRKEPTILWGTSVFTPVINVLLAGLRAELLLRGTYRGTLTAIY